MNLVPINWLGTQKERPGETQTSARGHPMLHTVITPLVYGRPPASAEGDQFVGSSSSLPGLCRARKTNLTKANIRFSFSRRKIELSQISGTAVSQTHRPYKKVNEKGIAKCPQKAGTVHITEGHCTSLLDWKSEATCSHNREEQHSTASQWSVSAAPFQLNELYARHDALVRKQNLSQPWRIEYKPRVAWRMARSKSSLSEKFAPQM